MPKPWEKFQQSNKPWEKFQQGGKAENIDSTLDVKEEQHPDISFKDRAIVKNFANSPEKAVAYLKQEHPNLDIQLKDNRIIAKNPEERSFKVVDPAGFDVQDITDVGFDVLGGVAEGVAGAAAGAIATPATLGAGAVPAAIAGSAAAGAGTEALRQRLGQALGIPQDIDTGDVLASAAISGAIPGVGKALKAVAPSAKWVGRKALGVARDVSDDVADVMIKKFDEVAAGGKDIILEAQTVGKSVGSAFKAARQKIGEKLGSTIKQGMEELGTSYNTGTEVVGVIQQEATRLASIGAEKESKDILKLINDILPNESWRKSINADQLSHLKKAVSDRISATARGFTPTSNDKERLILSIKDSIKNFENNVTSSIPGLKAKYELLTVKGDILDSSFGNPSKTLKTALSGGKQSEAGFKQILRDELSSKQAKDVLGKMQVLQAYTKLSSDPVMAAIPEAASKAATAAGTAAMVGTYGVGGKAASAKGLSELTKLGVGQLVGRKVTRAGIRAGKFLAPKAEAISRVGKLADKQKSKAAIKSIWNAAYAGLQEE